MSGDGDGTTRIVVVAVVKDTDESVGAMSESQFVVPLAT